MIHRIRTIYLIDNADSTDGESEASKVTGKNYATGLILEGVDGKFYAHLSTDPIRPFEQFTPPKDTL